MAFPQILELANREVSWSHDGAEIVNTFYCEPADTYHAVVCQLMGGRSVVAGGPSRQMPQIDPDYLGCLVTEVNIIPADTRQFSYVGNICDTSSMAGIVNAINFQTIFDNKIKLTGDLQTLKDIDIKRSAGVYIIAKYMPYMTLFNGSGEGTLDRLLDYMNPKYEMKIKENVINAGLRLLAPINAGVLGAAIGGPLVSGLSYYPSTGTAPIFKEQYTEFTIERRMVSVSNVVDTFLNSMVNCVNSEILDIPESFLPHYPVETFKFVGYDKKLVVMPSVNGAGNPQSFAEHFDYTLHFDIRQTTSQNAHDKSGNLIDPANPHSVGWNEMLVYPGDINALFNWLNNGAVGGNRDLGWYYCQYGVGFPRDVFAPNRAPYLGKGNASFQQLFKIGR